MKELKEIFTEEDLSLASTISSILGDTYHTRQGSGLYWDLVSVDLDDKEITFTYGIEGTHPHLSYTIQGVATQYNYEFVELLT